MNIRFLTANTSEYLLTEEPEGTYTLTRYNPLGNQMVKNTYTGMEILELAIGKNAHIKSKEPGYGDITTSPVAWIEVYK